MMKPNNPDTQHSESSGSAHHLGVTLSESLYTDLTKYSDSLIMKPSAVAEQLLFRALAKWATTSPSGLVDQLKSLAGKIDALLPLLPSSTPASEPSPASLVALRSVCEGARNLLQDATGHDLQQIRSLYYWLGALVEDREKAAQGEDGSKSGASNRIAVHREMARRYRLIRSLLRQFGLGEDIHEWAAEARRTPHATPPPDRY